MSEMTRRELLRRTGGAVPLLAAWQAVMDTDVSQAQETPSEQQVAFAKLSAVLTDSEQLNGVLVREYFSTMTSYMTSLGKLQEFMEFLQTFSELGPPDGPITPIQRAYIKGIMRTGQLECPLPPYNLAACRPTEPFQEAHALIDNWVKADFGCEQNVPKIVGVQPVCVADYENASVECFNSYVCQDVLCLWFMGAIYRDSDFIVPPQTFHYGSVLGYVSGLIWPTVGGGTHPYAQCGGEFGYWTTNPEPGNSAVDPC